MPQTLYLIPHNLYTLYLCPNSSPKTQALRPTRKQTERETERETSLGFRAIVNLPRAGEISRSTPLRFTTSLGFRCATRRSRRRRRVIEFYLF